MGCQCILIGIEIIAFVGYSNSLAEIILHPCKFYIFNFKIFQSNLLFGGGISVDISVVSIAVVEVVSSKKKV